LGQPTGGCSVARVVRNRLLNSPIGKVASPVETATWPPLAPPEHAQQLFSQQQGIYTMVFTSLRRFLMRYAEASRSRRLSHKSASLKKHRGTPLAAYWGRRWAFEQLEARLVPSTLTATKTAYAPTDP